MPPAFWVKRFLTVFGGSFAILLTVGLFKGRPVATAASESGLWAAISTTIFVATRSYHSRKGRACALCRDTPEPDPGAGNQPLKQDAAP